MRYLAFIVYTLFSAMTLASPHQDLQKVGEAKLRVLFWDIYHSELYSASGEFVEGQYPIALKIEYLRDIKAKDLLERTVDEWEKLGVSETLYSRWVPQIEQIWPDINKGDALTLVVSEDGVSEFYFNEQSIGKLQDTAFGSAFLSIWLDENCSYPKVRNQLLGML